MTDGWAWVSLSADNDDGGGGLTFVRVEHNLRLIWSFPPPTICLGSTIKTLLGSSDSYDDYSTPGPAAAALSVCLLRLKAK